VVAGEKQCLPLPWRVGVSTAGELVVALPDTLSAWTSPGAKARQAIFLILWLEEGQESSNAIKYCHCCLEGQRPDSV